MAGTIVVAGALAHRPYRGGHAWVFLQYLLGFRRLGWRVLFVDALDASMSLDASGTPCAAARSWNLQYLDAVMGAAGLSDAWALLADGGAKCFGVPRHELEARVRDSAFLLNINGYLRDDRVLAAAPRRAFLDIDPGVHQMWQALGLHDAFTGHDDFLTIGQRIGRTDCPIPSGGRQWTPTAPPVVLEHWPVVGPPDRRVFTSVGAWRGGMGPITFGSRTYGPRVHQFRKFVSLPRETGAMCELALDIHADEHRDLSLLREHDWVLVDPRAVAGTPDAYRSYVQRSAAEFLVAQGLYVDTQSGWMSDRSVCYLASGRPVVAQDTGLAELYPTGTGLCTFTSLADAVSAVRDVNARYEDHARAARALAEQYFDSDVVLREVLARLGVSSPR